MKIDKDSYYILVVEDNPGDYILVEEYLQEHIQKPILHHCKNFKKAVKFLDTTDHHIDIILLDLSLPDISKEKLIEAAKEISANIPVIILTGYADLDFATKSLAVGVSDYLVKDTITPLILYKSILYGLERFRFTSTLRESEKRYMELFHLSPAPVWVYEQGTLRFLDVNQAAIMHYGYSKEEFLLMTIRDIRPNEDQDILTSTMQMPKKGLLHRFKDYFRHLKKDGTIIFVEINSNEINFNGKPAQIILATDVTLRLQQINAIEEQNKKLREIAWTQSHIVRAPVARMMGLVDLLKNGELDEKEKNDMLGHIFTSAQEIDLIIRDIVQKSQSAYGSNEQ